MWVIHHHDAQVWVPCIDSLGKLCWLRLLPAQSLFLPNADRIISSLQCSFSSSRVNINWIWRTNHYVFSITKLVSLQEECLPDFDNQYPNMHCSEILFLFLRSIFIFFITFFEESCRKISSQLLCETTICLSICLLMKVTVTLNDLMLKENQSLVQSQYWSHTSTQDKYV